MPCLLSFRSDEACCCGSNQKASDGPSWRVCVEKLYGVVDEPATAVAVCVLMMMMSTGEEVRQVAVRAVLCCVHRPHGDCYNRYGSSSRARNKCEASIRV